MVDKPQFDFPFDWDGCDYTTPLTAVGNLSWAVTQSMREKNMGPLERAIAHMETHPEDYRW